VTVNAISVQQLNELENIDNESKIPFHTSTIPYPNILTLPITGF